MAAPTASFATVNQVGAREDLEDIIYDISPMQTYFTSTIGKGKATNILHDWQTDVLDTPVSSNAFVEGDDFSAQVINPTTKLRNYCQISRKDFVVTRTARKMNTAGRKEELAYQIVRKGDSLKRDIETAALSSNTTTAGSSVSARVSAGVEAFITSANHIKASGQNTATTPVPVSGLFVTPLTDGSATIFIESDLKLALQQAWSTGGETDTILVPPALKNKLDAFTGIATRFSDVRAGKQAQIVGAADVYVSSYGSHKVVLSRYMRASVVMCLDMSTWKLDWFDKMHLEDIAKSGDSEKRMIVAEWCLVGKTPSANTKIGNVN
jgi:hypothetical protein